MPKMSNKRKQEWALFLNERNRITYNDLCRRCANDCKQSYRSTVIQCRKYKSKRGVDYSKRSRDHPGR